MSSSAGTKVTKDPSAFSDPKNENPGVVTSDSLAGESITGGGSFGANSDARGPMDQPSSSTNTNTTDTSGATQLDPAPDAEARQAQQGWSETSQMSAGSSLGDSGSSGSGSGSGVGPTYSGAAGGSTQAPGSGSSSGQGATAPGYTSHPAPSMGDDFMPKGQNLKEGGFSSEDPNASFSTDIGGKNDPGRAALGGMEAANVPSAGGAGPRQGEITKDGQYDALDEASA